MEWISVKYKLPKEDAHVIVWGTSKCHCSNDTSYYLAKYDVDEDTWNYGEYSCNIDVTHWMIPESPK